MLTDNSLTCCFKFQTPGLERQDYQVWLAIFFLIGRTNTFAPECLASLFLIGNCLAKPGVWNVKQQGKMLTVNASLQMVVLYTRLCKLFSAPVTTTLGVFLWGSGGMMCWCCDILWINSKALRLLDPHSKIWLGVFSVLCGEFEKGILCLPLPILQCDTLS